MEKLPCFDDLEFPKAETFVKMTEKREKRESSSSYIYTAVYPELLHLEHFTEKFYILFF